MHTQARRQLNLYMACVHALEHTACALRCRESWE
jgi:hypothetical protein